MSVPAESWAPLLEDVAAAPTVTAMARFLFERGYLAGRAAWATSTR